MDTKIYLIRHCEAEGNVFRRCHGQYDSMVTKRGRRQIEALRARFADTELNRVYASTLFRAMTTAYHALARDRDMKLSLLPDIMEMSMGEWEDIPWGCLPQLYPQESENWNNSPWQLRIPGAETNEQVFTRGHRAILTIANENRGKTAAVVAHGAIIRVLLCNYFGWDYLRLMDVGWCDNTAVAELLVSEAGEIEILSANDNAHLSSEHSTFANQKWWRKNESPIDFNMCFRPVTEEDKTSIDTYARMFYESTYGNLDRYDAQAYFDETLAMAKNDARACVFSTLEGRITGFLRIVLDTPGGTGQIRTICLDKELHGLGHAAQLLGHAVSVFRQMGKKAVSVKVGKENHSARKFYDKYDFEPLSEDSDHIELIRPLSVKDMRAQIPIEG